LSEGSFIQRNKEHMKTISSTVYQGFVLFVLASFALLPKVQAVVPAPDGGYPGGNTAEGQAALLSLTTGAYNTAVGWYSLGSDMAGQFNTAVGAAALFLNIGDPTSGVGINNTATGAGALLSNTTGDFNTADGAFALADNTTGSGNTAIGEEALLRNTDGAVNVAIGANGVLSNNTMGNVNTAIGTGTLFSNTTGNSNIALGADAGSFLTTGDNNIDIGNHGVAGEGSTIRIGGDVGYGLQTATFIAGITGVAVVGDAVVVDTNGQLGTVASARRFKKEIKAMDRSSEAIFALKPVSFHYKNDSKGAPQFGLIAEEVADVNADLVVRDRNGEIYSVRYDAVNAMLLNEFLKEHHEVQELKKQVAALTAGLQKVTAQVERAPEMVSNNH
jgi:hypothetical protein